MCYKTGHLINWQTINSGCRPRWACGAWWGRSLSSLMRTIHPWPRAPGWTRDSSVPLPFISIWVSSELESSWCVLHPWYLFIVSLEVCTPDPYPRSPCLPLGTTNPTSLSVSATLIPISSAPGLAFPCSLVSTRCPAVLWKPAIPMGPRCSLTAGVTYVSLTVSDAAEHWAIPTSPLENFLLRSFASFSVELLSPLLYWFVNIYESN